MYLLSLLQLHTSRHIGTLSWALIVHNFQHKIHMSRALNVFIDFKDKYIIDEELVTI